MNTIKDMVSGGKLAQFMYYRAQHLYYKTECGFIFPVPIDDIGDATVLNEEKALMLMRYIRKHMDVIKNENETATQA